MDSVSLTRRSLVVLACAALVAACAHRTSETKPQSMPDILVDDRLGVDDEFEVRVVGEAEVSGSYRVGVDGMIVFPYVGSLEVAGLGPGQIQKLLVERLKDGYLVNPQVTVTMKEWNSRRISVLGQVNKPGPVPYTPKMTIVEAIAAAGGFTPVAAQNNVKLRREVQGKVESVTLRVGDISEGRQPNFELRPRDYVYVEERLF